MKDDYSLFLLNILPSMDISLLNFRNDVFKLNHIELHWGFISEILVFEEPESDIDSTLHVLKVIILLESLEYVNLFQ